MKTSKDKAIEKIARKILAIQDLKTRNRDALDFHEVGVWSLRDALDAAYEAGKASRSKE